MRFQTIDEPNADEVDLFKGTVIEGINDNGELVGGYEGISGAWGFTDVGGVFTTLFGPVGATNASAYGVNDSGQVVGAFEDVLNHAHGFLYSGGSYTTLSDPKAPNFTVAQGINASGQIVGWYATISEHGFLYSGGIYKDIDVPGSTATLAYGINSSGAIVGTFTDANGTHGFLDVNGSFTTLDDPLATSGTYAYGINDRGEIVGTYGDNIGVHGFRYSNGVFTTLDNTTGPSGTFGTRPFGINNAGQVVGDYSVQPGFLHGFEALPLVPDDFNSDGNSDILWRNANGSMAEWLMNGSQISASLVPSSQGNPVAPDGSWAVQAKPTNFG